MSSLLVGPRLLRRLVAAALALCVVLTTLGAGHPSCDASAAHEGAPSPAAAHAGMGAGHDGMPSADDAATRAPRGCPDHDRHDGRGAAACALVAHCAVGVVASALVVPASRVVRVAPTGEPTASRPLDASYQPDSPPPKA